MKVAVCISGQPRCAEETYPYIYNNIILPNNADIFIHMNYSKDITYIERTHLDNPYKNNTYRENIDEIVLNLYKPTRYLIEPPKDFKKSNIQISEARISRSLELNKHKQWSENDHKKHTIKQLLSMYYSIFKCNEIKENYANENGIVYDYVIRIRFDIKPQLPIRCDEYDPSFIYYQDLGQSDNLISDWINFGSNSVMNIYSSMYFMIEYLNSFQYFKKEDREKNTLEPSENIPGLYEHMVRDLMCLFKIPKRGIKLHCNIY